MTSIKVRTTVIENMIKSFSTTEEFYDFIVSINSISSDIAHCSDKTRSALKQANEPTDTDILLLEFEKIIYLCMFLQKNMDLLMPLLKEFQFDPYEPSEDHDAN